MKLLIIGAGAVGSVIATVCAKDNTYDEIILADLKMGIAEDVKKRLGDNKKITPIALNANNVEEMKKAMKGVDMTVNATLPRFFLKIMRACLESGSSYLDMATDLAVFNESPGTVVNRIPLDMQLDMDQAFKDQGIAGMLCWGADPGAVNVWARYAADQMDSIDTIQIRDGDTATVEGQSALVSFWSPDTLIEEVAFMNSLVWTKGRFERQAPLTRSEEWEFPQPVGKQRVWQVDHEEIQTMGRFMGKGVKEINFMLSLSDEFVTALKVLKSIGMVSPEPIDVKGVKVVPRDVITSLMPVPVDPAFQSKVKGHGCCSVKVVGMKSGRRIQHYLWNVMAHQECYKKYGGTATAVITGLPPAVAVIMRAKKEITMNGVYPPEVLEPLPIIKRLEEFGFMTSEEKREVVMPERRFTA
jgi:saccharopine dehydrogenase (NAD+, L-lysine-forming)